MMRNRLRRIRATGEEGTTLIEIMAGLVVMGVFLAMFSGTITNIFRTTGHFEATTVTTSQTNNSFLALDKMIRYASAISTPSTSPNASGNWYVEIQTANTGTTVCTQLQLNVNTKQLKTRTWTVPSLATYSNLTAFSLLGSNVLPGVPTGGGAAVPFTLVANPGLDTSAGANQQAPPFEVLTVNLAATFGSPPQTTTTNVAFTALNSNASSQAALRTPTAPNSVCQEVNRP